MKKRAADERLSPPIPRSVIDSAVWPAIPAPGPAMLLALQSQLAESQWWPREHLAFHQARQLGQLLDHATETVPLYREQFALAGYRASLPPNALSDFWPRLPILRRAALQRDPSRLFSASIPSSHGTTRRVTTSGTTGQPVGVVKSQLEQLFWQAITLREEIWHARDWQSTIAIIRSFSDEKYKLRDGALLPDWGSPLADVYPTGPAVALDVSVKLDVQAEWLVRHDPVYLLTTADNLRSLAEHFRRDSLVLSKLRDIRSVGNVVDSSLRQACREVFGVEIVDVYSCTEAGYLAIQCPSGPGLHIQMESVLLEVLDAEGRACAPGEAGEVVVTPLHNFATPLIRYAIGDRAVAGHPCSCGRGLPVLERVLGRSPAH